MTTNNINVSLIKSVTKVIGILSSQISKRLQSGDYPKELRNGVSTLPARDENGVVVGTVIVEGETVFAYEFGSGLWSERGIRAKYPIVPEGEVLKFLWPAGSEAAAFSDTGEELVVPGAGGLVHLPMVMHPGIRPQPFVQPAIDDRADEILEELGDDVVISISMALGPDVVVIS